MSTSACRFAALALLAALAPSAGALAADAGPFGPVHVSANRSGYDGKGCPVSIVYTATISLPGPHPKGFVFNYHWERSDGGKGKVQVVRPSEGQRSLTVHETWKLGKPGQKIDAGVKLFLDSGNSHLVETSPVVTVNCR